jgi:predicted dienelactone hydrolase
MWRILQLVVFVVAVLIGPCRTVHAFDPGKDGDGRLFDVGYRILDLKYQGRGGETALTVAVWYPTAVSPKPHIYGGTTEGKVAVDAEALAQGTPYPLLVFSHGYGGSGLGSVFFTEQLAARGWIVAAPDHHDRHSAVRIRTGQKRDFDRLGLMRHAREIASSGPADRDVYLYRIQELKLVLDRILESNSFGNLIDREKIAVGGHSLGGFTALGLCGTIDRLRDDRIKAVLLFSTGAGGYLFEDSELAAVKVPSMLLFGERERSQKRGTRTMVELADKVYSNLPPPKYLLEIMGANHFSFNNRFSDKWGARLLSGSEEQFQVIRRYSIAFLERHVAGKIEAEKTLQHQDPLLTRYLKESSHRGPQN